MKKVKIGDYNIQVLLYDLTFAHFKSKLLCKLGYHNYQIQCERKFTPIIREVFNPILEHKTHECIEYHKKIKLYYKCYCCGKEAEIDE